MNTQAYMAPATTVLAVEPQKVIAASTDQVMSVYSNENDGISDEEKILSRRRSIWEED